MNSLFLICGSVLTKTWRSRSRRPFKHTRGPEPAFFLVFLFFLWNWIKQACTDSLRFLFRFDCVHLHKFGKPMEQNVFNPTLLERLIAPIVSRSNGRKWKFQSLFSFGESPESLCILCDESLEKSSLPHMMECCSRAEVSLLPQRLQRSPSVSPDLFRYLGSTLCWLPPLGSCLFLTLLKLMGVLSLGW